MAGKESENLKKKREIVKEKFKRQIANPLSFESRLKVIAEYEEKKKPIRDLAKDYKVSPSQIQRILSNKSKYLEKSDSSRADSSISSVDLPRAESTIASAAIDGVDLINRMLLEKDLTEDSPNVAENESEDGRSMLNIGDADFESRSSEDENDENINDKSTNHSEYATSVSSEFSEDTVGDFEMEASDVPHELKSANRLFIEQAFQFMRKKKQQKAKWMARNKKLKRRLQERKKSIENLKEKLFVQQEKAKKFEKMTIEMKNQQMVKCTNCEEMKPKLTLDFCSFKCFQSILSPNT